MLRDIGLMVTFYATCAVHESGHIITLLSYGGRIKAVELSGTGIRIIIKKSGMIPVKSSLFILLSGPAANMIVFFMIKLTGCPPLREGRLRYALNQGNHGLYPMLLLFFL